MPFYTTDTGYTIMSADFTHGISVTDTGISIDQPFRFFRSADEVTGCEPTSFTLTLCGSSNCPLKHKCQNYRADFYHKNNPNTCEYFNDFID